MALDLKQAGSFAQPGPLGRGWRLIQGLVILYLISPLTALRPGGVIHVGDVGLWLGLAFTFLVANEVVKIGLGRDYGSWPRVGVVGLFALASLGDHFINGVWWGEIITLVIAAEILLVLGYLGISFLVAAALAVPG